MEKGRYKELLSFFYLLLKKASKEKFLLFKEFLKDVKIKEGELRKVRIKDSSLREILQHITYSERLKKSLKKDTLPKKVKDYIEEFISKIEDNARRFFQAYKPGPKELSIKRDLPDRLTITASRRFFPEDDRILPDDKNVFNFELSFFWDKEKKSLSIDFSCWFEVKEESIPDFRSDNFTIFDKFVEALGLSDFNKGVSFDAIYSEGETFYDNTCEVCWQKLWIKV